MSKYIRKDNVSTVVFKRENPDLYEFIMEQYSPVFDRITAIEMYLNDIPPPICEICNKRLLVTKKMPRRCSAHINTEIENLYDHQRLLIKYPHLNILYFDGLKNTQFKVVSVCSEHGSYEQPIMSILNGHGCQQCYFTNMVGQYRIDEEEYLRTFREIHDDRYDYSLVKFCGAQGKIDIICKKHGIFSQQANVHKVGHGCPKCSVSNMSRKEIRWLDSLCIPEEYRQKNIYIDGKRIKVDAFDRITNTIYEFWGDFWHGNLSTYNIDDVNPRNKKTFGELFEETQVKRKLILEAGYTLIEIWEDEWENMQWN